ncbi:branched-chain amino acid ABC transporter ATP-binding protein/permease [Variovorax ginsengisoli]|uniref:ATP-binding cassette domain-containing protein n=1 Tax=Variovorax ginsengisoli TaxID=363844 RepID=A0ABT8SA39_9BURK|nr:ATP-binding cassette domain-containing protein [Variovorax ginsengisoli]MDN8616612.1 ATP-binding cassette domain-containing protein [Variovorax ginsengisoli]MDO1535782.1 ATP-binding cassette domain-containing protein [Variovorax ginsengisoli]
MDSLDAVEHPSCAALCRPARRWRLPGSEALWLGAALVVLPFASNDFVAYQIALFLIYGIATQGVALCWGRLGFLPLGHALFFGLGAYLAGGTLKAAQQQPLWYLALPLALLLPAAVAYVTARLVFARSHRSGPFFSLITLAMTMLGFLAAQQWSAVTGGFNGMADIPELPGTERYSSFYWVVAACAVGSTALLGLVLRRPLGMLWSAVAQNEDRLQLFGYATDRIKAFAFGFSALLAAAAGALFALHQGIVTPLTMGFVLSTEFVIWAAVGGKASPLGALLGAVFIGYASSELRDHFAYWEVAVGAIFIGVVRFLPEGLAGLGRPLWRRGPAAAPGVPATDAPARHAPDGRIGLAFEQVHAAQGGVRILDGLALALDGPGLRCVIGPNGAGKTSAFNVMTGRLPLRSGRILLDGADISGAAAWRVARRDVGRKLQIPSVFSELSVSQNLDVALWAGRLGPAMSLARAPLGWRSPLRDELLDLFPALREQLATRAGSLSQGHRQALEFVMTVLPQPRLVLLDEPCAGLSPAETHHMIDAIKTVIDRLGAAALVIEHDISAVAAIGGDVYVLHQGRLLAQGSLAEIQGDPAVRAVYAGARK